MTELLLRTAADVELSGDGRTVEGMAFIFDRPSLVTDDGRTRYREAFTRGSVGRTLSQRTTPRPLFVAHRHIEGSVGETTFEPSGEGLVFRARLHDGSLAEIARDRLSRGELPAVSIGFRPLASRTRADALGDITERTEISLDELSLCETGQHEGARVLAVRAVAGTPRLDALRRRRALLVTPR